MFFLSGAMYPVSKLPAALKTVSRLNPLTYGVDALKHSVLGNAGIVDFSIITDIAVLVISAIVFIIAAGLLFERKK